MKEIAVFFGGRSCEHDVSIVTGLQAIENMDTSKYKIHPVYIARDGLWYTGEGLRNIAGYQNFAPSENIVRCTLSQRPGEGLLVKHQPLHIDAALLCMHGMHGEDGSLQGMLEMCDIPYTSAGIGGSAAGMDKVLMKKVFLGCGFPTVDYVAFYRREFETQPQKVVERAQEAIGYPCYVKPASLGSSIGISKAQNEAQLKQALELAFLYDRKVLVETGIAQPMEINCSVLGMDGEAEASLCERPIGWEEYLTFEDKYLKGAKRPTRTIPADISEELTKRIQTMAVEIFCALDCKGVVRIDFLVDRTDGKLYVNEINTIPGSLSFYLWEPKGLSYSALLDRLIEQAITSMEEKKKNSYAYESRLLDAMKNASFSGTKGSKGGAKFGGGKMGIKR